MRTGRKDALDELFARNAAVGVAVGAPEHVGQSRFVQLHPVDVALAPRVEIEVPHVLQLRAE